MALLRLPTKVHARVAAVPSVWWRHDSLHLSPTNKVLTVYIPTTPNPTSGYLVIVSSEDVIDLDFSVEDAFKFIVSGGASSGRTLGRVNRMSPVYSGG